MQITVIQQRIYEIRGQIVMLDFDLAELYDVETKRVKEAVRRNKVRFPSDFMFQLTKKEFNSLRSQIATSNKRGGTRYMPIK
jgi:ORF6N domain